MSVFSLNVCGKQVSYPKGPTSHKNVLAVQMYLLCIQMHYIQEGGARNAITVYQINGCLYFSQRLRFIIFLQKYPYQAC